jgi:hypothetical protein
MNSYIDLLEEAGDLLYEIFHSADDSVADYKLDVEIAYTFVRKALDTEDRLDVFRALQKVHDVLETDGEEPVGGDLVDRIKNALEGLREHKKMDISEIKDMVREVVKEIYQKPRPPETFGDVLASLEDKLDQSVPPLNNSEQGRKQAHVILNRIRVVTQAIIKSALKSNREIYEKASNSFNHDMHGLMMLLVVWANKISQVNPNLKNIINRPMNDFKDHLQQIAGQTSRIIGNVAGKDLERPNYINAIKEMEHLKEIISNTAVSIDEVFDLTKGLKFK